MLNEISGEWSVNIDVMNGWKRYVTGALLFGVNEEYDNDDDNDDDNNDDGGSFHMQLELNPKKKNEKKLSNNKASIKWCSTS